MQMEMFSEKVVSEMPKASENEQWIDHPEIKNLSVSSLGRIRSNGRELRQSCVSRGYLSCHVPKPGGTIRRLSHSLVAEAFIGKKPDGCVVDHVDGDKLNNSARNLQYCTFGSNVARHKWHLKGAKAKGDGWSNYLAWRMNHPFPCAI